MPRSRAIARLRIPALLSVTLGLAPFTPEPHILGKLRWVAGGAVGMGAMDWLDLLLHGAPFMALLVSLGAVLRERSEPPDDTATQT